MKVMLLLRTAFLAALLTFGLVAVAPVAAQDDATEVVDEATQQAEEVQEESEGFDDWGLLGLLGLAGLAGLMRRPQPVVHENERTTGRVDDTTL